MAKAPPPFGGFGALGGYQLLELGPARPPVRPVPLVMLAAPDAEPGVLLVTGWAVALG
jgi:hypothetical protein